MTSLIFDQLLEKQIKAERRAAGSDRYDEVWEGICMMAPMPNDEHQELVMGLSSLIHEMIGRPGLGSVRPGVNVSDRETDWTQNYRVPDVAVFLNDGQAVNHGTHWQGGPDFVVEVASVDDRTRDKLPFYETINVRELLLIDRNPWGLELHRLEAKSLRLVGRSDAQLSGELQSGILPLTLRLVAAEPRPRIEVTADGTQRQLV